MINRFSKQSYEARIDALQRQVEEQSMTMSMYSSYTPEDFNNIEEDIFGESRTGFLYILFGVAMPDRLGVSRYMLLSGFITRIFFINFRTN